MPGLWVQERVAEAGPPDAPLIVFVHGSLDRASSFSKVVRRLSDLHTVVYDRRGYAGSSDVGPPFTVADQVDDLLFVMQERAAVVVGHSYGGNVVLAAAQARPDLVGALVVFEAPMPWTDWWPATSGGYSIVRQSRAQDDPGDISERFMRRMIGDERWERLPAATRESRRSEGPALVGEITDLGRAAPYDAATVMAPAVVARGENGANHHRQSTEFLFSTLPNPTMVTISGAGHGAHTSHPDEFAAIVRLAVATCG
jgi:pimeloyl-ACP methyl ester carboxylesterase